MMLRLRPTPNGLYLWALLIFLNSCTCEKKVPDAPPLDTLPADDASFHVNLVPGNDSKDPLFVLSQDRLELLSLVFEPLLSYSSQSGEIVPLLLADLPTVSADQKLYSFRLRKDVPFHASSALPSGRTVTSRDVVLSLLRGVLAGEDSNYGSLLAGLVQGISEWEKSESGGEWFNRGLPSGIEIKNEREFSVRLLRKYPDFLALLTLPAFSVIPHELIGGGELKAAVGTGPYRFTDSSPQSQNWSLKGPPDSKFSMIRVTESLDAKLLAVSDYSSLPHKVASELLESQANEEKGALKYMPGHVPKDRSLRRLELLVFNLKDPLVKKAGLSLRKALMTVIDGEAILKALYQSFYVRELQYIPPGVEGALTKFNFKLESPEAAKILLEKQLKSSNLTVLYPDSSSYWIAQLQSNLESVGPFFKFEEVPTSEYFERIERGAFQVAPLSWEGDLPEATNYLQLYYASGESNAQNLSGYKSKSFDQAFDKLSKLFPSAQRAAQAEAAHRIVLADLPAIPIGFKRELVALSERASSIDVSGPGFGSLREFLLSR